MPPCPHADKKAHPERIIIIFEKFVIYTPWLYHSTRNDYAHPSEDTIQIRTDKKVQIPSQKPFVRFICDEKEYTLIK